MFNERNFCLKTEKCYFLVKMNAYLQWWACRRRGWLERLNRLQSLLHVEPGERSRTAMRNADVYWGNVLESFKEYNITTVILSVLSLKNIKKKLSLECSVSYQVDHCPCLYTIHPVFLLSRRIYCCGICRDIIETHCSLRHNSGKTLQSAGVHLRNNTWQAIGVYSWIMALALLHAQLNNDLVYFWLQGALWGSSSVTHQFLGLFQACAADMHDYFIHPVETSTHMHSHMLK